MERNHTPLNEVGEFRIIDIVTNQFKLQNKSSVLGVGDDAALIQSGDIYKAISTDLLVEGVHFDLSYYPLKHLGYKAVTVNLSDIAAMNAIPQQITVSIALSNRFSLEAIQELYQGIYLACQQYKVDLIGGDTSTTMGGSSISVTAIGEVAPPKVTKRTGAKSNDIICVTGDLGAAYLGLQILMREKEVFKSNPEMQPELDAYSYLIQRQLKPEARVDLIHTFEEIGLIPTSMIDISDGLASELLHLAHASKVGVKVYEDKLPIDQLAYKTAEELNLSPTTCMFNGGEDYELLFTIDQKDLPKVDKSEHIHMIGYVTEESQGTHLVTQADTVVPITAQGWKAF